MKFPQTCAGHLLRRHVQRCRRGREARVNLSQRSRSPNLVAVDPVQKSLTFWGFSGKPLDFQKNKSQDPTQQQSSESHWGNCPFRVCLSRETRGWLVQCLISGLVGNPILCQADPLLILMGVRPLLWVTTFMGGERTMRGIRLQPFL